MAGVRSNTMADYATIEDITTLYRPLTEAETTKATALLPVVSARLRQYGKHTGRDLDAMIEADENLAVVAKSVTVDVIARNLQTPTEGPPMSQFSEAALGYSVSGTFLVPGGGIFIKNSELKALGLLRPKYRTLDMCGEGGDPDGVC